MEKALRSIERRMKKKGIEKGLNAQGAAGLWGSGARMCGRGRLPRQSQRQRPGWEAQLLHVEESALFHLVESPLISFQYFQEYPLILFHILLVFSVLFTSLERIPEHIPEGRCVLRLRYNMTSGDFGQAALAAQKGPATSQPLS